MKKLKQTTTNILRLGVTTGTIGLLLLANAVKAENQKIQPDKNNNSDDDGNQENLNFTGVINTVIPFKAPDLTPPEILSTQVEENIFQIPQSKITNANIPLVGIPGVKLAFPGQIKTISGRPEIALALRQKEIEKNRNIAKLDSNYNLNNIDIDIDKNVINNDQSTVIANNKELDKNNKKLAKKVSGQESIKENLAQTVLSSIDNSLIDNEQNTVTTNKENIKKDNNVSVNKNNVETPKTEEVKKDNNVSKNVETPKIEEIKKDAANVSVNKNNVETSKIEEVKKDSSVKTSVNNTDIKILTPITNDVLDKPATTVILQITGVKPEDNLEPELRVNGVLVDSSSVGRNEVSGNTITQTWYGVTLNEGENTITAQIKGTNNLNSIKVQVAGSPTQLKIKTLESRVPADGRSIVNVTGELIDKNGNRSNRDGVITLTSTDGEFIGADQDKDAPGFQVLAKKGQFTTPLRSGLEAKQVYIKANNLIYNIEAFTTVSFDTDLRPSLVTGVIDLRLGGKGNDYYGSFRDFLPLNGDNSTKFTGRTAVFATGKVFGNWLFTGAFDNTRTLNQDCNGNNRLFKDSQFCNNNYAVYGDSSSTTRTTPSQDSLYLKLEQSARIPGADPNYFMWGDYNTNEFSTSSQQFTSTTRSLHGFKLNYNVGSLQLSGFYGDNLQGFQRDTIAPDGTSGYYFLSRQLLVGGSENISIELEELNRPGFVIKKTSLQRGPDYEIDYDRGSIIFKEPVLRTDIDKKGQVLVRRIVVTYQYEDKAADNSIYGGRLRYHFDRNSGTESWLGASFVQENKGLRTFEMYGVDGLISIGPNTQIIAEYAQSRNDSEVMGTVKGSAYRVEAKTRISKEIQARGYFQSTDAGFANNATTSFVPGQTRYGTDVNVDVTSSTQLKVQYDHEANFGTAPRPLTNFNDLFTPRTEAVPGSQVNNSLDTITAGLQQRFGTSIVNLDWIHRDRKDNLPNAPLSSTSEQLRSRLTVPVASGISAFLQNETSLSGKDTVASDRTGLGVNWSVAPGVTLQLGQQWFHGGVLNGKSLLNVSVLSDYKLGSDTTLTGRYTVVNGANGLSTQGALGLNQKWSISPGLKLNLAYERLFGSDSFVSTGAGLQSAQPFTSGQSASSIGVSGGESYSLGLEYNDNPNFQASARYEKRSSSSGTNNTITAGITGKILPELTGLVRYQQNNAGNQQISGLGDTVDFKLGLAYRDPNNDSVNALIKYEYRQNPAVIPNTILLNRGTGSEDHTLSLEGIYAPNWQWEFYSKFALRNSTSYLASDLVGSSTISLLQGRATYRVGYNFDLVGEGRLINQYNTGYTETGFSAELGYYLTPNLRFALGYSSGSIAGDLVGDRSAGGFYGGLSIKINELFDGFGLQKPLPKQQKESSVQPVAKVPQSQKPVAQLPQTLNLDVSQKLEFIPDNSQLNDQNLTLLNNLAIVLKEYPSLSVEIQGNLPPISKINSQDVDSKRVGNARSYLISKGIRSNQILIRSTGKSKDKETEKGELKLVINGNSDTFIAMAGRLKNGGLSSPLLETLQASLPPEILNQVPNQVATNTVPETVASVPNIATPIKADQSLNFSLNADINPNNQKALDEIALTLQKEPNKTVEIQGYLKGGNNTNPELEMERVIAVRTYLLDKGINENQVIIRELVGDTVASNNQQNKVDLLFGNNADNNTAQSKPNTPVALIPPENNTKPNTPVALIPTNISTTNLSFGTDDNITAQSREVLDKIALKLKDDTTAKVEIQGYLSIGGDAKLEQQRVTKIKEYLSLKGVSLDKISIKELDNSNKLATNQIDLIISSTGDIIPTAQAKPNVPVALIPTNISTTNLSFGTDDNITAQSRDVLDKIALKLKDDTTAKVEIQGYLSIGGDAKLEQQRVTKIKEYLSLKGVSLDKISIKELDNTNKLATNQIDLIISSTGDIIPTAQAKPNTPVALNPSNINNVKQISQSVEFSLDTNITAQSKEILNQMASVLQSNRAIAIELQGYLSPKNPDAEKEMQRVISVRNYLLEKGVQEQQIAIRPLDDNQLAGGNTEQKVSQINKVDVIFSVAENSTNALLSPDSDPNLLRFTSALNYLMGDEKTAKETLFKAMGITKPESQGALIDPDLFRKK